jgi:hypothetical protein
MTDSIDKLDVVEALAEALDNKRIDGLGYVLVGADSEELGTLVIQAWPDGDDKPSVDFLARITRFRQPSATVPEVRPSEGENR